MEADGQDRRWCDAPDELVVLGAGNIVGDRLLARLAAAGRGALALSRRPRAVPAPSRLLQIDVLGDDAWRVPAGAEVVSILPLAVLARALPRLDGARSLVAIGSTSLLGKAASTDPADRAVAESLSQAETALAAWGASRGVPWTVLRPTLVYDGVGDRNVARMARVVRRFGVLPLAAPAKGLRQPIHADDVAKAVLAALGNPRARNRAFNIAGAEVLSYRAMAERVFQALGQRPRVLALPAGALEAGFRLGAGLGLLRADGLGPTLFRRMNEDLVYDVRPGLDALDYAPRPFELPDLR